jgi:hypothetical protein
VLDPDAWKVVVQEAALLGIAVVSDENAPAASRASPTVRTSCGGLDATVENSNASTGWSEVLTTEPFKWHDDQAGAPPSGHVLTRTIVFPGARVQQCQPGHTFAFQYGNTHGTLPGGFGISFVEMYGGGAGNSAIPARTDPHSVFPSELLAGDTSCAERDGKPVIVVLFERRADSVSAAVMFPLITPAGLSSRRSS